MQWRQIILATGLLAAMPALPPAEAPAQEDADASRDLVMLTADGPVIVRILLEVDGAGFRQRWREYADRLFSSLDDNNDRALDPTEAEDIPPSISSGQLAGEQRSLWSQMDANPTDGKVTAEEFQPFVVRTLEQSVTIRPFSTTRTQAVALFPRLDADRDGVLSADEIAHGYRTLHKDDIDANDVLGIDELLPPQDPTQQEEVRSTADAELDIPFIEVRDAPGAREQLVELLLNRYSRRTGAEDAAAPPPGLTKAQLAVDEKRMARLDANHDGLLDGKELAEWLAQPVPRVRFLVQLKVRSFGSPKVELLSDDDHLADGVRQEAAGRLELSLAGTKMTLAATRPRTTVSDATNLYLTRFLMADADKNRYLDEQEFGALALPAGDFATVDKDGDGKVFRDELKIFVEVSSRVADATLTATVMKQGETLFQMLDDNTDLRLTRREFHEGPQRLANLDADGDGRFGEAEFQHRYLFSFRSGESPLLSSSDPINPGGANAQSTPIVRDDTTGPEWFQRMDRNRDGDVSQREFLGSPDAFRRLDVDGDGLLTADEAEMAKPGR